MTLFRNTNPARAALTALLFLGLCSCVLAQAPRQSFEGFLQAADAQAAKGDDYTAYRMYLLATEYTDAKNYDARIGEARYKAGVSAYNVSAYRVAEQQLLGLLQLPAASNYPLAKYYLGQANFRQGEYDEAAVYFQQFLDENPAATPGVSERFLNSARAQITDADLAIDAMARADSITLTRLPTGINSEDMDVMYTYGPGGERYFTTNRFVWNQDSLKQHRLLSRIMRRTGETTAEKLPERINRPGKNVAHTAFTADQKTVFFSICDFAAANDETICELYRAPVGTDAEWGEPVRLSVNASGADNTQPSVGMVDGQEFLFFSSDRSGGAGGLDLYRAPINADGSVGAATNLEALNTVGDEGTPFWYAPNQTLYFSTDGRFSFGGMDLYRSYWLDGRFRRPINLGHPVNSSADDAYYTRFDDEIAYVGSRRPRADALFYTGEKEICCYEIYSFPPDTRIDLLATTYNKLTEEELAGATVALYEMTPDGPVLVAEITNPDGNEFNFAVEPCKQYELRATKDGYSRDIDAFDLCDDAFRGKPFVERKLYLAPKIDLDVFTFNNVDRKPLNGVEVELYEVNDDGSQTLLDTKLSADANEYRFELEQGKRYRVEGRRTDYGEDYAEVDLRNYTPDMGNPIRRDLFIGQLLDILVIDGRTDEPLNGATVRLLRADGTKVTDDKTNPDGNDFHYVVNLDQPFVVTTSREGYLTRTDTLTFTRQDLVDGGGRLTFYIPLFNLESFLPFEVYFDNDYPNPRSYRTTTDRSYDQTYDPYLERQATFLEEFTAGMSNEDAFLARGNMNQFFDQEVKAGYDQLQRFAQALQQHLRSGQAFTLELKGYASPRAATEYNRRLSSRRIRSVENYFRTYAGGALLPYIRSEQLTFTEAPLGESTADASRISDRLDRPQESVFSILASLERRVELGLPLTLKKKK